MYYRSPPGGRQPQPGVGKRILGTGKVGRLEGRRTACVHLSSRQCQGLESFWELLRER